jgi:hypothetical protein
VSLFDVEVLGRIEAVIKIVARAGSRGRLSEKQEAGARAGRAGVDGQQRGSVGGFCALEPSRAPNEDENHDSRSSGSYIAQLLQPDKTRARAAANQPTEEKAG